MIFGAQIFAVLSQKEASYFIKILRKLVIFTFCAAFLGKK